MESKTHLEIGDKLKRFEVTKEIDIVYEIESVTKTLAKSTNGRVFYRELNYNSTKPKENYIAEVKCKEVTSLGKRYFLIN